MLLADEKFFLIAVQLKFSLNIHKGITDNTNDDKQTRRRYQEQPGASRGSG